MRTHIFPATLCVAMLACVGAVLAAISGNGLAQGYPEAALARQAWSDEEKAVLASMHIDRLPPPPADPSNAAAARPEAVALGQRLFHDTGMSANGKVSCATCHVPDRQFQDGLPVGRGIGTGTRRTMPVAGAAYSPWLFWDGRKDSLWSQALGPIEDPAEHGSSRLRVARQVSEHYRREYETVFGSLPPLAGLPAADASPLGDPAARRRWDDLTPAQRDAIDRVFANAGKAIAAYERTLTIGPSRFDRYVDGVAGKDPAGLQALSAQEVRGLRLFIGRAQCATCHTGPLLTDHAFHNTGVPARDGGGGSKDSGHAGAGRAAAIARLRADPFNCLGHYSDAAPGACTELRFLADDDPAMEGAFRTPGLRNVDLRSPYMHAGQFSRLEDVVEHYVRAPAATTGVSELGKARPPIALSERDIRDIAAFLGSLSGNIVQRSAS